MRLSTQHTTKPSFPSINNDKKRGLPLRSLAVSLAAGALFSFACSSEKPESTPEKEVATPSSRKSARTGPTGKGPGELPLSLADADGDGIPDKSDRCPYKREDKDGHQDTDGCPDYDNDHDGIADVNDKCPNSPEDKLGPNVNDGCPKRKIHIRTAGVPVRINPPVHP